MKLRKRNDWRKRKTNSLSAFHLLSGLALLLLSFSLASLLFRLNTLGLPLRSVIICHAIFKHCPSSLQDTKDYGLYIIWDIEIHQHHIPSIFLFSRQTIYCSARSLSRWRSEYIFANLVLGSRSRPIQPS